MTTGKLITVLAMIGLIAGCGGYFSNPSANEPEQTDRVSECDGFEAAGGHLFGGGGARSDYCAAEMLHWQYQPESQTLSLANTRVPLNCCGNHAMIVTEQEGVYLVTEYDDPDQYGRCLCTCVFDFVVELSGVLSGNIPIRIEREVSDWPEGSGLVFEGELDLSEGSGSIVIDESDVSWICGQSQYHQ